MRVILTNCLLYLRQKQLLYLLIFNLHLKLAYEGVMCSRTWAENAEAIGKKAKQEEQDSCVISEKLIRPQHDHSYTELTESRTVHLKDLFYLGLHKALLNEAITSQD